MNFPVQKIVCLTEETTEILYALNQQHRIVGISAFTVRPEQARKEKEVVSQYIRADLDRIEALKPDLVLAFSDLQADICAQLIRRGLTVHCFNQRSLSDILGVVKTVGALVGQSEEADQYADRLQDNLDRVRDLANALPRRPRVYFEEWPDPIITGIRWVSELIEIAGGIDCFADRRDQPLAADRTVTPEEVLARKPELYLASWCGRKFRPDTALSRPGFENAPFTRPDRMVEIDSSIILQPGPAALTDGLDALHEQISRVARMQKDDTPNPQEVR